MSILAWCSRLVSLQAKQGCLALSALLCLPFESVSAQASRQAAADGGLVIFGYQRIGEDEFPGTSIDADEFAAQMQELKAGGYVVMPLADAVESLRRGSALPPRAVAITLDGGFRSAHEQAVPQLRAARLPFTMFVVPDAIGTSGRISWGELREIRKTGAAIGVQTASSYHMPLADPGKNEAELNRAIARYRDEFGSAPSLFAYPYGSSDQTARSLVARRSFAAAFGQQGGVAHRHSDLLDLPRVMISEQFGGIERFRLAAQALPLPIIDLLPAQAVLTENPPNVGFTVIERGDLTRLSCSGTGQGRLPVQQLGSSRVEVRVPEVFEPGRVRINCTLPLADGRYRSLGLQFLVPSNVAVEEPE